MAERVTFSLPEDLVERLNAQFDYGDNRSAWVAEAIEEKLEREAGEEGNSKTSTATN